MKTQDVKMYAAQQLHRLQALPDNQQRAELAKLRRGIGHAPGELPELWGSFLLEMPESFQSRSAPSAAEWAVYLALTLYAVHQQGNDRPMNCPGNTLGRAVRQLAERNTKLYSITGTPPSLYNKIVGDSFAPRNPYCLKIDTLNQKI